jgi:hypothetical protein
VSAKRDAMGFTIMEVMVAIMILSVSVVSIFGAQFAAVATTEYSKHMTYALTLAECRMSEIELDVLTEDGFQLGTVTSSGDCCEAIEDEKIGDYTCSWEIKPVELPDIEALLSAGGADGGMGLLEDLDLGVDAEEEAEGLDIFGTLSAFLPLLSDMLAEGIRRVTVTVKWQQGSREREFSLSQHIVHPTEGSLGLMNAALMGQDTEGTGDSSADEPASPRGTMPGLRSGSSR